MRFIIIGAGAVGTGLSQRLTSDQHDVVLIERHESHINKIAAELDLEILLGNGASPEMLVRAGIHTADYVVAVANIDEVNIATCLTAKLLNPAAKRIARIRHLSLVHPEVAPEHVSEYFDLIINPAQATADYLAQLFKVPGAKEMVDFCDGELRVLGLPVAPNSPLAGRQISTLSDLQEQFPVLAIAIIRGNKIVVPKGSHIIHPGDLVYFVTIPEKTAVLFEMAGKTLSEGKNAVIWGEDTVGCFLALALEKQGTPVKLILSDPKLAISRIDDFDSTLVLSGQGTDQKLLIEENVGDADAFIAVTANEENNILSALLAKNLGASMTMALINKPIYKELVGAIGVDVAVSSREAAASAIFRHVHSESVISEFSLRDLHAGFIEVSVTKDMPIVNQSLDKIKTPSGIIFAAIMRDKHVIIPRGSDTINADDRLVIFVMSTAQRKLERLLGVKLEFFV